VPPVTISMAADYPDRVAGVVYGRDIVVRRLREVGCAVRETRAGGHADHRPVAGGRPRPPSPDHAGTGRSALVALLEVTPPSWRPDLTDPADLAEEVIRLEGYENVPVRMPRALAGRGLTPRQRLRRSVGRTLAESGYVEVLSSPFASRSDADLLGCCRRRPAPSGGGGGEPAQRGRAAAAHDAAARPVPGAGRNIGRGFADTALFEIGLVFRPRPGAAPRRRSSPSTGGLRCPNSPRSRPRCPTSRCGSAPSWRRPRARPAGGGRAAGRLGGRDRGGPSGRPRICRVSLDVRADAYAPWHPGRCAALYAQVAPGDGGQREWLAGHAGELHPRVIAAFGLPERTCAMELDLSVVFTAAERPAGPVQAPQLSAIRWRPRTWR
jgi:phenylalanyl-tRNA synthetase beta chain